MNDERFFNFPVHFLQNAFTNFNKTLENIYQYGFYNYAYSLEGNEKERVKKASEFYNIKSNPTSLYETGRSLSQTIPEKSPMTGINKDMLFDFYENIKTDDEISVLLAFLALKSIIGANPYNKTYNRFLIARMGGYKSINDLPDPLPEHLAKYNTRRKLDRIKRDLQFEWNVNIYGKGVKGFYISINSKTSLEDLIMIADKNKIINKEKILKAKKDKAQQSSKSEIEKICKNGSSTETEKKQSISRTTKEKVDWRKDLIPMTR